MPPTLPDINLAAWHTVTCRTSFCLQPIGRRCVDRDGDRCPPHPARIADFAVWLTAQVEDLQRALDLADAEVTRLTEGLRVVTEERDGLRAQVTDLTRRVSDAAEDITSLQSERTQLLTRIAELEHPPPPDPEPEPVQRTLFGACPEKPGGTTLADARRVIAKWGPGAAVRQFLSTGVAPRPPDAEIMHVSWKPTLAQVTDSWVARVCTNLKPGDCVEVIHEGDKKVTDGKYTFAQVVEMKNAFHDSVKRVRPDLLVVNTLTGWLLDPKSKGDVDRWATVRADVLGVDCDGVRPTALPYTNYEDETKRAVKFLADHPGYQWFAVPEFGCPRIPAADPDGKIRAAYHDKYADLWAATGKCLFVTLYEYDSSPNYSLTTAAETAGWAKRITVR